MTSVIRAMLAAVALTASVTAAFASASTTPTMYQPDPALKTESMAELTNRVRKSCAVTQAKLQSADELSFGRKCDCYAGRTLRALSNDEVQAYRDTGVFNETARAKALTSIDSCKLQRPAL
jgi:predicted transglutaminase-like cysteine proteinase